MPDELTPVFGLSLALALAYFATPLAIRAADRFEFYDQPIGYKGHGRPTPYLGGAAVVGAFLVVVLLLATDGSRTLPLVAGVAGLWVLGTIDDRRTVSPRIRVAMESGLATALWALGHSWELGAGAGIDLVVTVLWILGVVNAFNLFDNMDGAAGSMATVAAGGVAILGVVVDDPWVAVAGAALCGACLGFLPHNLSSPAKIFLGDGGSMPIGFGVAALAMMGASSAAASWQALAIGLLMVGVPALDTCLVIVSRMRRGIPLMTGGRDHLTHRTRQRLQTVRAVMLALGAAQVVLATLAVLAASGGSVVLFAATFVYLVAVSAAIFVFDGRPGAPFAREGPTLALPDRSPRRVPRPAVAMRRIGRVEGGGLWSAGVLLVLGLAIGISPFFEGLYSPQKWAPVGIVLVIAFVAGVMARPFTPSLPTSVFVIALSVLALFALLSSTWAPSPERAFIEGNRIFLYIALAGLLLVAIRDDRAATVGLVAATVGSIVVVGYLAVEMAIGDGQQLFLGGRLHEPMAYINGQGTMLLLTFFPLLALAEHARRPALAGVGAALAALVAGVALLTQSRGVALAGIAGLAVVLLAVPGRRWRIAALTVVGIGVAIAARQLFDVLPASGAPEFADVVESASRGLLVCAAAVGLVWAAVCLAARHVPEGRRARAARAWSVGLGVAAVLVVALAAANAGRIASGIGHEYDAFVKLEGSEAGPVTSRLLSGGGNRYDYWRIAVHAWEDSPLRGGGAGAYPVAYFRERTTTEDIRQPHSLGLQALSELGLVGLILVLIAGAAVAVAARRRLLALGESRARRSLLVAALGTAVAWAVHASVDWPHLIPGVTAFALIAVAVLLRPDRLQPTPEPESDPAPARPPAWRRLAPAVGLAGLLAVAGFSLSRQVLTDHYRSEAEAALEAGRPADAIEQADRALRLAPNGIDPYYSKAAAYARFNEPGAARATLEEAIRREPTNFVTYVLMGDLEVRVGRYGAARRAYRSASELNPQDVELATLAEDPTAAHEKLSP